MSRLITREDVKKHNNERSLWMVIHNEVYDVTKFLDEHPGGVDSLMDYAGKDGTQGFEDVGHSDDAREIMKKYKIGTLPPGEHTNPDVSCAQAAPTWGKDCFVYQTSSSCPGLPKSRRPERTWRTFDGTSDRPISPKKEHKAPRTPRAEGRVQTIVVPRESSKLKWALLALGAAIIIGVVIKKYAT